MSLHGRPGAYSERQDGGQCHSTVIISRTGTLRWGEMRSSGSQMQACIVVVWHCHGF